MADTKGKQQEENQRHKTPQDVMEDIHYIIYPETELDGRESVGDEAELRGGAYDYLKEQYGNRADWDQFEQLYQEELEIINGSYLYTGKEMLDEKQRLLDLRMELEGVKGSINLNDIPEVVQATNKEAQRFLEHQNSGLAAITAFDKYAATCLSGTRKDNDKEAGHKKENNRNDDHTRISGARETAIKREKKKEQESQNKMLIRHLEEASGQGKEYVVRGAPLMCNCGTHSRHLDMLESHGIYVNRKAVALEEDYNEGVNISYFGHCKSPITDLTETISLRMRRNVNTDGVGLSEYDGSIYVGVKCVPSLHTPWENTHDTTCIAEDGEEGMEADECTYKKAVTTASYLSCRQGGIIYPLSSGQQDESYYQAPFQNYPFEDIGSDTFMKWCEKNSICPYMPGTSDYYSWYREKIDGLKQKREELQSLSGQWYKDIIGGNSVNPYQSEIIANEKELKNMYETFLDQAYEKGLDTMEDKEEDKIRETVEEYVDSDLLSPKEKVQISDRYSGLRLKYGDNGRKQEDGYIWKDQELYDKTIEKLLMLRERMAWMEEITADTGQKEAGKIYQNYANREADDLYNTFMTEVVTYGPGYAGLDPEKREAAGKVHDAYYSLKGDTNPPNLEEDMNTFDQ